MLIFHLIFFIYSFWHQAIIKPQYVDQIPRAVNGIVEGLINNKSEKNNKDDMIDVLDLKDVLGRQVKELSGGELQRFAIAVVCIQKADM
jgi:ATP-binding cassette subfamily E protein 1